jgi:hypothetical protein
MDKFLLVFSKIKYSINLILMTDKKKLISAVVKNLSSAVIEGSNNGAKRLESETKSVVPVVRQAPSEQQNQNKLQKKETFFTEFLIFLKNQSNIKNAINNYPINVRTVLESNTSLSRDTINIVQSYYISHCALHFNRDDVSGVYEEYLHERLYDDMSDYILYVVKILRDHLVIILEYHRSEGEQDYNFLPRSTSLLFRHLFKHGYGIDEFKRVILNLKDDNRYNKEKCDNLSKEKRPLRKEKDPLVIRELISRDVAELDYLRDQSETESRVMQDCRCSSCDQIESDDYGGGYGRGSSMCNCSFYYEQSCREVERLDKLIDHLEQKISHVKDLIYNDSYFELQDAVKKEFDLSHDFQGVRYCYIDQLCPDCGIDRDCRGHFTSDSHPGDGAIEYYYLRQDCRECHNACDMRHFYIRYVSDYKLEENMSCFNAMINRATGDHVDPIVEWRHEEKYRRSAEAAPLIRYEMDRLGSNWREIRFRGHVTYPARGGKFVYYRNGNCSYCRVGYECLGHLIN